MAKGKIAWKLAWILNESWSVSLSSLLNIRFFSSGVLSPLFSSPLLRRRPLSLASRNALNLPALLQLHFSASPATYFFSPDPEHRHASSSLLLILFFGPFDALLSSTLPHRSPLPPIILFLSSSTDRITVGGETHSSSLPVERLNGECRVRADGVWRDSKVSRNFVDRRILFIYRRVDEGTTRGVG